MPAVDEGCVSFRGYETWYRRVRHGGSDGGVPLLCLHGGPGSTHRGLTTLEALADERDVVLYDQLGSGNSSQPSDPALWTVGLFVEEVAAVREALGLDRLHLLGRHDRRSCLRRGELRVLPPAPLPARSVAGGRR